MTQKSNSRKGTVVTIGENMKKRIPMVFDEVYKIDEFPVDDDDDISKDETFRGYTMRSITVDTTSVVKNGTAVNVNGEFDISLKDEDIEKENLLDRVYSIKEEAIVAWNELEKAQQVKAELLLEKMNRVVNHYKRVVEEQAF